MEYKNGWKRVLALGLSAALLLSGCTGGGSEEEKKTDPTPTPVVESDAPTDWSKYNAYIEMSDILYELEDLLNAYFTYVEAAPEFALVEGAEYGDLKQAFQFYTAHTYPAEEALDYADEEPAYPAADLAIQALGNSPVEMMEALDDLAAYLRFDEYEEDSMAKAPEIHNAIWAALEDFVNYDSFLMAVSEMAAEGDEEEMNKLLEGGELILYYSLHMINLSEDLIGDIWDQVWAANPDTESSEVVFPVIDMTVIAPLATEFESDYAALIEALGNTDEQGKVSAFSGAVAEGAIKLYTSKVDYFHSSVAALVTAVSSGGNDYYDALTAAGEAYSSMIDGYNSII